MAQPLSWVFEIFDKMSAPAQKIAGAVGKVTGAVKGASDSLGKFQKATEGASKTTDVWLGRLGIGAVAAIGAAVAIDKLAEATAGIQKTGRIFRNLLGGDEAAALTGYLDRIQRHTEFTRTQLDGLVQPLLQAGLKTAEISRLLPAALDVKALGGDSTKAIEQFQKIALLGKIEGEAFKDLGINAQDAMARIAQAAGRSVKATQEAMAAGKLNRSAIFEGIFGAISAKTGGPLGTGAIQASQDLDALLNKAKGIPSDLFRNLDMTPVTSIASAALNKLLALFDPTTASGAKFMGAIQGVVNSIADMFGWMDRNREILGVVATAVGGAVAGLLVLKGVLLAVAVAQGILNGVMMINPIVALAVGVGVAAALIWTYWDQISGFFRGIYQAATEWIGKVGEFLKGLPGAILQGGINIATALIDGYVSGLTNGYGRVWDAIKGLGTGAIDGLKSILGIASPSKVFESMGRFSGEGFVRGLDMSGSSIQDAMSRTISLDTRVRGGGGLGSRSIEVNLGGVHLHAGAQVDAQSLSRQVAEILPGMLASTLDQLAVEAGV